MRIRLRPAGSTAPSLVPAPCSIASAEAGMSTITQCQMPAPPVTASGSWTIRVKLSAPGGGFSQASAGEMLAPLQPRPLNANLSSKGLSGPKSGLVSLNICAFAAHAQTNSASAAEILLLRSCLPKRLRRMVRRDAVPSDSGRPNHLFRVLTVGGCIDNQQFQALASHTNRVEDALRKEEHVAGTHFMLYAVDACEGCALENVRCLLQPRVRVRQGIAAARDVAEHDLHVAWSGVRTDQTRVDGAMVVGGAVAGHLRCAKAPASRDASLIVCGCDGVRHGSVPLVQSSEGVRSRRVAGRPGSDALRVGRILGRRPPSKKYNLWKEAITWMKVIPGATAPRITGGPQLPSSPGSVPRMPKAMKTEEGLNALCVREREGAIRACGGAVTRRW